MAIELGDGDRQRLSDAGQSIRPGERRQTTGRHLVEQSVPGVYIRRSTSSSHCLLPAVVPTMAERPVTTSPSRFQAAIDELTDGLSQLVRQHFELARSEVRREAQNIADISSDIAIYALLGAIGAVGYLLLNVAIILVALWLGSVAAMAITALVLAVLQLSIGGIGVAMAVRRFKESDIEPLRETTEELQKDKQWIKEIRDNSSPKRLPEQTS